MDKIIIIKDNEKLIEAYNVLWEKISGICDQFQLSYFEIYGIMDAVKCDLYNQVNQEEED